MATKEQLATQGQIGFERYVAANIPRLTELIRKYATDPDPLNLLPELYGARAVLHTAMVHFGTRLEEWKRNPDGDMPDIARVQKCIETVTEVVNTIDKMQARKAIPKEAVARLASEMYYIVETEVGEEVAERIRKKWQRIR